METKKQNMYNADMKKDLTIERLQKEARHFSKQVSNYDDPSLFGATDGKAVGTYLKHRFKNFLAQNYTFDSGNSASGIDFPGLLVDIKTTSITQPQSSCPFKSAEQNKQAEYSSYHFCGSRQNSGLSADIEHSSYS